MLRHSMKITPRIIVTRSSPISTAVSLVHQGCFNRILLLRSVLCVEKSLLK